MSYIQLHVVGHSLSYNKHLKCLERDEVNLEKYSKLVEKPEKDLDFFFQKVVATL